MWVKPYPEGEPMAVDPVRVKSLFQEASDYRSPAERAAYLDRECAGEPELRARVEVLLTAQDRADAVLEPDPTGVCELTSPESLQGTAASNAADRSPEPGATGVSRPSFASSQVTIDERGPDSTLPAAPGAPPARSPSGSVAGLVIAGRYSLVDVLGEGGMGTVYRAEQTQPVKRGVALKLIKVGMDSRAVLARFDAERQALALMDHTNIARVYDGGATESGQPYFVMELVNGVAITDYCDQNRLSVQPRLELFVSVCQAVQHAHQKGIIHRDLKPSNVMVTEVDGRPTPKIIDFGVAKAIEFDLTDKSLADTGAIVGTPTYMSPEQADPSSTDIDTRTDVYALGVILYELLAGSPPIDVRQFKRGAILEMLRMVREVDPPRPSTKLSTADDLPNIAAKRSIEPARLAKSLRGELDWVVMKALEKDRTRRYDTANGLARDIQRYLADEVVEARPPSRGYRLKKFVRRNKVQVVAAGLLTLSLVVGMAGTGIGLVRANRSAEAERQAKVKAQTAAEAERQAKVQAQTAAEAEKAAKLDAERKRQEAETNLAFAAKGNAILGSVFAELDPRATHETVAELRNALRDNLNKAVQDLHGSAIGDPVIVATLQNTLALSLIGLGEAKAAIVLLEKAAATRKAGLGADHPGTLESRHNLARAYWQAGQRDLAVPIFDETLKLQKARLGPDHPATLTTMRDLATAYRDTGKLGLAVPLFEETLKLQKARLGPNKLETLGTMSGLAHAYQDAGKMDLALPLALETLKRNEARLGPNHPITLASLNLLAGVYQFSGKLDLAIPLFEKALTLRKARLGLEHPATISSMNNLALAYANAEKLDLALPLFVETLKLQKEKRGPEDADTLTTMDGLANTYLKTGRLDLAIPLSEEALKFRKARLGPSHRATLNGMNNLAAAYWQAQRLDKSIPLFEESLKLKLANLGKDHPDTLRTKANLGINYKDAGRLTDAIPLLEESYRAAKRNPGLDWIGPQLLDGYAKAGNKAEATKLGAALVLDIHKRFPEGSPQRAQELASLALLLVQAKAFIESEPLLRESLAIRAKTQPNAWSTFNTRSVLGGSLLGQKKYAAAEPLLVAGYEGLKQREKSIPPQGATRLPEALDRLIELSTATNNPDQIKKWQAEREKYPASVVTPQPKK